MSGSGSCWAPADRKPKTKAADGRLEVEFQVDSNKVGQRWSVRMKDDGHSFFTGTRTTSAPSGSFRFTRRPANRAGSDPVKAVASNAKTGETCSGAVFF